MRCKVSRFVCPPGTNNLFFPGVQTFLTHKREGTNIFISRGDKHFYIKVGGQTFLHRGGDKHFMLEAVVAMMMFMKRWM